MTARSQGVWLNCDDEIILNEELASEIEEPLEDDRGFIESRDQKRVCVVCYREQSSSLCPTSEQESSPRMQMDKGEVEVEEARKRERAELRFSPQTRRETSTTSCVQCCATGAVRARKDVRNTPTDVQQVGRQDR